MQAHRWRDTVCESIDIHDHRYIATSVIRTSGLARIPMFDLTDQPRICLLQANNSLSTQLVCCICSNARGPVNWTRGLARNLHTLLLKGLRRACICIRIVIGHCKWPVYFSLSLPYLWCPFLQISESYRWYSICQKSKTTWELLHANSPGPGVLITYTPITTPTT
jgi:hypothetical protein